LSTKDRNLNTFNRYIGITALLFGTSSSASMLINRRYGRAAARRFRVGMSSALIVQQALLGIAVWRSGGRGSNDHRHQLDLVDLMTLSRSWAASLLAGLVASGLRDRRGITGWMGWLALLYGSILCDWLDGPIARHRGTTQLGALLDLEADSWLTLCAAAGAVQWGNLPLMTASPPLLRYGLMCKDLRTTPYTDLFANEPDWGRHIGMGQMLLYIGALAPFRGPATSRLVWLAAPVQTSLQLCALLALHRRRSRS
jgi:CDP-alcohol phosphatidyltransferase